jgi:hypothetical protein
MNIIEQSPTTLITGKLESDGQYVVKTVVEEQHIIDHTQALKNSKLIVPGKNRAPLQPDGAKVIWWFQAHPLLWKRHKKKYPDVHAALHSRDQISRELAAKIIASQHPEWIVTAPKIL